jgi:hypothetical protein
MKLLRHPAHSLSSLFWDGNGVCACHLFEHCNLTIALDEVYRSIEIPQASERFTWHRARKHIAPDHYMIYFIFTHILEYSLKCRQVPVNIINCCDPHGGPSSLARECLRPTTLHDSLAFLHVNHLVGLNVFEPIHLPARPADFHFVGLGSGTHAEVQS